jgi:hypothetical protein
VDLSDKSNTMERRAHDRFHFRKGVTITWVSPRGPISCAGNCFEASKHGLSAEARECVPVGTRVTIQLNGLDEGVAATVRHCRKHGYWYIIGLECREQAVNSQPGATVQPLPA